MKFSELSEQAQRYAYGLYCEAMNDEWNRENILTIEEYGAAADCEGLEFDESGEVV